MKSVLEYKDYHRFMQDYYDERKRLGAFSWREFCKSAGFTSPNFLKLVCMGQSKLSKVKVGNVAKAMGLSGFEEDYFREMVVFGNAEKDDVKKTALLKCRESRRNTRCAWLMEICSSIMNPGSILF